jgi:hypothetical protein
LAEAHGLGLGKLAQPLRAALAGRTVSPSVFDMMLVIGREETLARISDATNCLIAPARAAGKAMRNRPPLAANEERE